MGVVDDRLRQLRELEAKLANGAPGLPGGGGGGTSGDVSDDWKEGVDRQLGQLHDDFRRLVGWLIAAVAAPLLALVGLYAYVGTKFDAVEARFERLDARLAAIEIQQARMEQRFIDKLDEIGRAQKPAKAR